MGTLGHLCNRLEFKDPVLPPGKHPFLRNEAKDTCPGVPGPISSRFPLMGITDSTDGPVLSSSAQPFLS